MSVDDVKDIMRPQRSGGDALFAEVKTQKSHRRTKRCSKCKEIKTISSFHRDITRNDLHKSICKICSLKAQKEYKEKNKLKINANQREYRKKNKKKLQLKKKEYARSFDGRFIKSKNNALHRGLVWKITKSQYKELLKESCIYCNNEIENKETKLNFSFCGDATGVGLDRIDNNKGYVKDNVVRCCGFCNNLRGRLLTTEETKVAIKAILEFRKQNADK